MKFIQYISRFRKHGAPALIVLIAFVLVTNASFHPVASACGKADVEQSILPEDDTEMPKTYLEYNIKAVVPVVQALLFHQPTLEFDFKVILELEDQKDINLPLRVDPYFRTLFRLIISPNAP